MAFRSIGDIKSIMKWHLYYEAVMLKTKELGGVGCIDVLDITRYQNQNSTTDKGKLSVVRMH